MINATNGNWYLKFGRENLQTRTGQDHPEHFVTGVMCPLALSILKPVLIQRQSEFQAYLSVHKDIRAREEAPKLSLKTVNTIGLIPPEKATLQRML
jgi:hypothetical protein